MSRSLAWRAILKRPWNHHLSPRCSPVKGFNSESVRIGKETLPGVQQTKRVLSFGDGTHGALGHPDRYFCDAYEPTVVEGLPETCVKVAAGHYHSMAITESGELWAWGRNVEGQLGRRAEQSREKWCQVQKVEGLEGVNVQEAIGSGVVSMAIDVDGYLWSWGKSRRGQLGLGEGVIEASLPQRIQALAGKQVVQVALGWGHALACTAEGHLYAWGYCADGRLGFSRQCMLSNEQDRSSQSAKCQGDDAARAELAALQVREDIEREINPVLQWEPHIVDLQGCGAIEVACGFDHSLVLCEGGVLLSFGDDTYGQLGRAVGRDSVREVRGQLFNRQVVSISAGLGHSLAVALDFTHDEPWQARQQPAGTGFSWGWNSAFQLGRATGRKPGKIEMLAEGEVLKLAGGRVHSVAITSKGKLWAWGSGKNGRLGLGSFMDEQQPCLVEAVEGLLVQQAVCGMDHTLLLASMR